jgi:DNA-binding transcriptional MocR family regulator
MNGESPCQTFHNLPRVPQTAGTLVATAAPTQPRSSWEPPMSSLRATAGMASPLGAAIATRWIEDGTVSLVRRAIEKESEARRAIAGAVLPRGAARIPEHGFHVWLELPPPWSRGEFSARLRSAGISVVPSDAFALSAPPEGVRLGLGGTATRDDLSQGLHIVADLLGQSPAMSNMVV